MSYISGRLAQVPLLRAKNRNLRHAANLDGWLEYRKSITWSSDPFTFYALLYCHVIGWLSNCWHVQVCPPCTLSIFLSIWSNVRREIGLALKAAPPWIIDLMKMPRSSPVSLDLLPFRLSPSPADPESLTGISYTRCSLPSSDRVWPDDSPF